MMDEGASPEGPRAAAKPAKGRPALRPRRHFFAAVAVLLAACVTPPALEPSLPEPAERAAPESQQAATALRRLGKAEGSPLLQRLSRVEAGIDAPLVGGNEAQLLIDGPQTHAAMLKAIAAARRHIHLESYILESRPAFDSMLAAKRAQGVQVNILYDSVGSIGTPAEYFQRLSAAGITFCEFNPVNPFKASAGRQINNRDHRKLLVVDGVIAFTGGINISRVYASSSFSRKRKPADPKEGWRDTHIQVRGPVVADFQRLFMDSWESQNCPPLATEDKATAFPALARQGEQEMRLVAADPRVGRNELYIALLLAIANARERVWLTSGYFVPDERLLHSLERAARRGVDVRLVLPGFSDFWAPFHAGRARYGELLDAGVRIFERRDALLHAKTAAVDGIWTSVGSTNLDWRSFVSNYEADLIVFDRSFARQLEHLFQLDEAASHEVSLVEWRKRSISERIKEWLARWWERFL